MCGGRAVWRCVHLILAASATRGRSARGKARRDHETITQTRRQLLPEASPALLHSTLYNAPCTTIAAPASPSSTNYTAHHTTSASSTILRYMPRPDPRNTTLARCPPAHTPLRHTSPPDCDPTYHQPTAADSPSPLQPTPPGTLEENLRLGTRCPALSAVLLHGHPTERLRSCSIEQPPILLPRGLRCGVRQ